MIIDALVEHLRQHGYCHPNYLIDKLDYIGIRPWFNGNFIYYHEVKISINSDYAVIWSTRTQGDALQIHTNDPDYLDKIINRLKTYYS